MDRDVLCALARDTGAEVRFGEPLARHTSLGIGGKAEFFLRPSGWASVPGLLEALWETGTPFRVLAGGTNLLVEDGPLGFGVVALARLGGSARWEDAGAEVDADLPLPALCAGASRLGLSGLEGMEGVPGTVGGGLVMNAGAFGCEMAKVVTEVRVVERGRGAVLRPAADLSFGYRRSSLCALGVAAGCRIALAPSDVEQVRRDAAEARARRQATQPWRESTAGSVFKNPARDHAGRVLEQLGFKGRWRGGAVFSALHANFLTNAGGATFADAFGLCEEARGAAERAGVRLEYEVEIWRRSGAAEGAP